MFKRRNILEFVKAVHFPKNGSFRYKTVFTGLQPTGVPHLGNYLNVIKPLINSMKAQNEDKYYIMIADMHAITVPQNPEHLRKNINDLTAVLLSCGLNSNENSILFLQSLVSGHTQLAWILSTLCTLRKLSHLPQWRDKLLKLAINSNIKDDDLFAHEKLELGLFSYPVLMASDILLFDSDIVPVGPDQVSHLEFTRTLAKNFNSRYSVEYFKAPEMNLYDENKVCSLQDPNNKMSKSDKKQYATLLLNDSTEIIHQKIKRAQTDSIRSISYNPIERPGLSNLIRIFSNITDASIDQILEKVSKMTKVEFKNALTDSLNFHLEPIRTSYQQFLIDKHQLCDTIKAGSSAANAISSTRIESILDIVGCSIKYK